MKCHLNIFDFTQSNILNIILILSIKTFAAVTLFLILNRK